MPERKYTLKEAQAELHRQTCARQGHDFRIVLAVGHDGPAFIACDRCGKSWTCKAGSPGRANTWTRASRPL